MSAPAMNDLWAQLRSLGSDFTPAQIQATTALMAPLAPRPGPDVEVHRDVVYGPDPRHRLDIFVPSAGVRRAPVLVFVHGGGFVMGDKGAPDAPFYNNVGLWAARSGCIGVTITYRLAPPRLGRPAAKMPAPPFAFFMPPASSGAATRTASFCWASQRARSTWQDMLRSRGCTWRPVAASPEPS